MENVIITPERLSLADKLVHKIEQSFVFKMEEEKILDVPVQALQFYQGLTIGIISSLSRNRESSPSMHGMTGTFRRGAEFVVLSVLPRVSVFTDVGVDRAYVLSTLLRRLTFRMTNPMVSEMRGFFTGVGL